MTATITRLKPPAPLRRGEYYWLDGGPYVSVTNVLNEIAKQNILIKWAAGSAFDAWCENPNISREEAEAAPNRRRDKAASAGSLLHSLYEAHAKGDVSEADPPEAVRGHWDAFHKWIATAQPEFLLAETTVVNEEHGYAGTGDLWALLGGRCYIVDYKTGFVDLFSCAMQEEAYARGEYGIDPQTRERVTLPEVEGIGVLQTRADGNFNWYDLTEGREKAWQNFRGYLHTWHARRDKECAEGCWCR